MYGLRLVTTVFIASVLFGEIMAIPHMDKKGIGIDLLMILANVMSLICMWGIYE